MVQIIKYRKIYYTIATILIVFSIGALSVWGLRLSIDFTGGSLLSGTFSQEVLENEDLAIILNAIGIEGAIIQKSGEKGIIMRFAEIDQKKHQELLNIIEKKAQKENQDNFFEEESFKTIGPSLGKELWSKSITALIIVFILIITFVAFAFRKVSYPLSSWKYGVVTLVALLHDIIIPLGLFSVLGHFYRVEISSAFIAALLTILGYSVNDSLVIFDRIRENLMRRQGGTFEETVNISLNQTFVRSFNTSITVILVLLAVYFYGGESVKYLSLALMVGVGAGTYSSIFIGSSLLVSWNNWIERTK